MVSRSWIAAVGAAGGTALLIAAGARADASRESRYPYDPACAWGRVADGKGMLVRCMTQAESKEVLAAAAARKKARDEAAKCGSAGKEAPDGKDAAKEAPKEAPKDAPKEAPKSVPVSVTFRELKVDEGKLPEAVKRLSTVSQRLNACVETNGGLTREVGELDLRFLVRERGRAEGVEVKRHQGLSLAAGRCVADVIDRRLVGLPSVPVTGANLILEFRPAPAKAPARKQP
ncbi:MAG: hypothetical protein KIT72_02555 [Polyangiaceae bacterium]|nr:hypothetical protein [Polyangiaceae bacterium]MCW5789280.1 hypothetical protein [Polyangiaceae bacterium]